MSIRSIDRKPIFADLRLILLDSDSVSCCPLCPVQCLWDQGGADLHPSRSLPAPAVAPSLTSHWECWITTWLQGCKVPHSCLLPCKAVHTLETQWTWQLFYSIFFFFPHLLPLIAALSWQVSLVNSGAPTTLGVSQPCPESHCTLLNLGQSGTWRCGEPVSVPHQHRHTLPPSGFSSGTSACCCPHGLRMSLRGRSPTPLIPIPAKPEDGRS